jgi:hypothetical protein
VGYAIGSRLAGLPFFQYNPPMPSRDKLAEFVALPWPPPIFRKLACCAGKETSACQEHFTDLCRLLC